MNDQRKKLAIVLVIGAFGGGCLSYVFGAFFTLSPGDGYHLYVPIDQTLGGAGVLAFFVGTIGWKKHNRIFRRSFRGAPPNLFLQFGRGAASFIFAAMLSSMALAAVTILVSVLEGSWDGVFFAFFAFSFLYMAVYFSGGLIILFGGITGIVATLVANCDSELSKEV